MSAQMNQYLVHYRHDSGEDCDARIVKAHRVEGWSEDYAFFGHFKVMDEVTELIPRCLVSRVELMYDKYGNEAQCGCHPHENCTSTSCDMS